MIRKIRNSDELEENGYRKIHFPGTMDTYYTKEFQGDTIVYRAIGDGLFELAGIADKDGRPREL
jgi:hypothetical protein